MNRPRKPSATQLEILRLLANGGSITIMTTMDGGMWIRRENAPSLTVPQPTMHILEQEKWVQRDRYRFPSHEAHITDRGMAVLQEATNVAKG